MNETEDNIVGLGYLGVVLMRALDMTYQEAQESLDYIRAYCKHHNYTISVEKVNEEDTTNPTRTDA